jgi:hypothetical protein
MEAALTGPDCQASLISRPVPERFLDVAGALGRYRARWPPEARVDLAPRQDLNAITAMRNRRNDPQGVSLDLSTARSNDALYTTNHRAGNPTAYVSI